MIIILLFPNFWVPRIQIKSIFTVRYNIFIPITYGLRTFDEFERFYYSIEKNDGVWSMMDAVVLCWED